MKIGGNALSARANRTAVAWTATREQMAAMADVTKIGTVNYSDGSAAHASRDLTDTAGWLAGGAAAAQQYAPVYVAGVGDVTIHSLDTAGSWFGSPCVLACPAWAPGDILIRHQSSSEATAAKRVTSPNGATIRVPPGHAIALVHDGSTWQVME